jgi:ACS family tartrate transporter-like MFS transporter
VINFVDRINIGFAALTMNKELAINSQQFGLLSGIFFWGYFVFEIPSNLLLHKLGARIWIARILVSWGIVAILTGFVRTATHLYILRFLLGLAEAGLFPIYIVTWRTGSLSDNWRMQSRCSTVLAQSPASLALRSQE